ncbi:MAG: DUF3316 domain-containing protein [Bacteroidaceae bacterium]|nr:DUF3316 domain-containing protein [Bacteroidaceae bacterium]
MRKIFFILIILTNLLPLPIMGEGAGERVSTHATLFGIGHVNHLDTYLSPLEYQGPQLTYLHETFRPLLRNEHIVFQTTTQGEFSYSKNEAETAHYLGGSIRYDFGWGRRWCDILLPGLDLTAGGLAGGTLGFLYNNRNTNNPAQARADLRLSAAFRADYCFHIRKQTLALHYQAHLPLLGMAFSPQYGQSYYDLFDQGNYDHNLVCTYPGNALSLRQLLTLDIPIRRSTLRLGYLSDLRQLKVNGIRQHQYGRSFIIGYVRNISFRP